MMGCLFSILHIMKAWPQRNDEVICDSSCWGTLLLELRHLWFIIFLWGIYFCVTCLCQHRIFYQKCIIHVIIIMRCSASFQCFCGMCPLLCKYCCIWCLWWSFIDHLNLWCSWRQFIAHPSVHNTYVYHSIASLISSTFCYFIQTTALCTCVEDPWGYFGLKWIRTIMFEVRF
jgi:hypothetical protein